MAPKPKLDLVRPSVAAAAARSAAQRIEAGDARLVVQMTASQHQDVKVHAASLGLSIREYVMDLLIRDGACRRK